MALHKPTQRLDFFYDRNPNVIYLRASITIELNYSEYIPTTSVVIVDNKAPDFVIELDIMENNTDQDGWYEYPLTVLIPTNVNQDVYVPSGDTDAALNTLKEYIASELKACGTSQYSVKTKAIKAGNMDGEVTNTISEDGEMEIGD